MLDKPYEWTSFDVVNKVRVQLRMKMQIKKIKVGHAGTLDPLATGLLVICTGRATKKIANLQGLNKTYTGTIKLGSTTPSFDLETEEDEHFSTEHIKEEMIHDTAHSFLGEQLQRPPTFSAKQINGERAYVKARKGEDFIVPPKQITINRFEITDINMPHVSFEVDCSTGTYIRSLAHDFGKVLKSGAHLTSLRRTKVGEYHVENAFNAEKFGEILEEITAVNA